MSDRITRKPSDAREKDLQLALSRIQRGRAHTKETKVTIASVAREAGVSTALIHNHYPKLLIKLRSELNVKVSVFKFWFKSI